MRIPDPSPNFLVKYHLIMMGVWLAVTPVTIKYPSSVLWVALMSQYANFVGHFSGYDATRAERTSLAEIKALRQEVRRLAKAA